MKKICFFLAGVLFSAGLFADTRFVKMNMKNPADSSLIKVAQVSEKSEITGNVKQTTVELIITNSSSRILEGEFEFPLEEGESVCGFALDINGKLRPAVAVEKEKGRQVFEEIVRRGVDPGLVEMTQGNNFKTRIYPIPAKGFRQLQITYEKELSADSEEVVKDTVFTQTSGKETYFYYMPDLTDIKGQVAAKTLPGKVAVYFDVSASAKNRNLQKEYNLLKKYLEYCKCTEITCVTFSNTVHEQKTFQNSQQLIDFLKTQSYDGGTNMKLDFSSVTADEILLFSDGLHNFGEEEPVRGNGYFSKKGQIPVVAVNSSSSADFGALKAVSDNFVNLYECSEEKALELLTVENLKLLKAEFDGKSVTEVYPAAGENITDRFSIAGILNKKNGKVKLEFGYNGKVLKTVDLNLSSVEEEGTVQADNVNRLWAVKKIASLSDSYEKNKDEITKLAKLYTVVTKDTSLIVLDTVQDYVRYGIVPPDELKDEYNRLTGNGNSTFKNQKNEISQLVYQNFNAYKKWWNTNPEDFKKNKKSKGDIYSPEIPIAVERTVESMNTMVVEDALVMAEAAPVVTRTAAAPRMATASARASAALDNFVEEEALTVNGPQNVQNEQIQPQVVLQAWSSNADYISVLKKTATDKMYAKYLELKKDYEKSPAFYMEVSDYFYEEELKDEALRILSNLAELNLENSDILRALGNKLIEREEYKLAAVIFEKLTKIRGEVPQFYRDLGLAYNLAGESQKAIEALWKIVCGTWDSRYAEIQQTALNDMNAIIEANKGKLDTSSMDKDLLQNFDVDIRIVLTWNTDNCDVDLWVTDPDNEKCFYGYKLTKNGGRMSRDFTQGYGPEEFAIRVAPKGKYKIQANYYGNHQQKQLQPVIVQAEVYTNFGRKNQTRQVLTLQLDNIKQTFDIGEIEF